MIVTAGQAHAASQVSLQWDASSASIDGYRVYARTNNGSYNYSQPSWTGNGTSCTISGLAANTGYFFVVRAFQANNESADSNEVYFNNGATNAGSDSDNDGMPDDWETQHGLNPQVPDANADPDDDGQTNIQEYLAGSDPIVAEGNRAPNTPSITDPSSGTADVLLTPVFTAGPFSDPDGDDAHLKSQWRIVRASTGETVFSVQTASHLTTVQVPLLVLNGNTNYTVQVRYLDNHGQASAWSAAVAFTTAADDSDTDGNGIPDDQQTDGSGDINADGIADGLQADTVKCVYSLDGSRMVGVSIEDSDTATWLEWTGIIDPQAVAVGPYDSDAMLLGLLGYKLHVGQPGQSVQVKVFFSDPLAAHSLWVKYDAVNGWSDYSANVVIGDDNQSAIVWLTDGGAGDADGVANGIIVDPSGPVAGAAIGGGGSGGGGGGCFISSLGF